MSILKFISISGFSASLFIISSMANVSSQNIVIYSDTQSKITGTWKGQGTLGQVNSGAYEGSTCYKYNYNIASYWDGFAFDVSNWGASPISCSGATGLHVAYKGISAANTILIKVHTGTPDSPTEYYSLNPATTWTVLDLPWADFKYADKLNLAQVKSIEFTLMGTSSGTGEFYVDQVWLIGASSSSTINQVLSINTEISRLTSQKAGAFTLNGSSVQGGIRGSGMIVSPRGIFCTMAGSAMRWHE